MLEFSQPRTNPTSLDAFARVRTSNPVTLFDSQSQYDTLSNVVFYEKTVGAASVTHLPNEGAARLDVTTASGDRVVRQTREYVRYQPGKSQLILMTGVFASGQTNMKQYMGYGDDDNGFFLKEEAGSVALVKRSKITGSVVDTEVAQTAWNIDQLDGNGPSGVTLDPEQAQILWFDFEWLGVGSVFAGLMVGRQVVPVHRFDHANVIDSVYITTANLPVRWEIVNDTGVAAGASMKAICCSVISEGGLQESPRGIPFCASNGIVPITVNGGTTPVPIIGIRPKATFNGITNRGRIIISGVSALAQNEIIHVRGRWDATITGGSWVSVHPDSIVEYNVTGTSVTGGIPVNAFSVPAASQGSNNNPGSGGAGLLGRLPMTLDIDGANPTEFWVTGLEFTGTTGSLSANVFWQETR